MGQIWIRYAVHARESIGLWRRAAGPRARWGRLGHAVDSAQMLILNKKSFFFFKSIL
jgi:hypothetical protein